MNKILTKDRPLLITIKTRTKQFIMLAITGRSLLRSVNESQAK